MKTNYVPAIVMLLAGAVYCVIGLMSGTPLLEFSVQLLIVLLVFYILGGIIRMVLDHFMGEVDADKKETENVSNKKDNSDKVVLKEETSDEETSEGDTSEEGM